MSLSKTDFVLYVPSCQAAQGQTQPLATALSLDAAKNLCHQHFLKQARTLQFRLPRDRRAELPSAVLDTITLRWTQVPAGYHEGRPEGCQTAALASIAGTTYQLHPAEKE